MIVVTHVECSFSALCSYLPYLKPTSNSPELRRVADIAEHTLQSSETPFKLGNNQISIKMLPLLKSDRKPQKCQITCSTLPTFIDPLQPPQKSAPFNALWALKWCHTVDVLLPAELRDVIKQTEARQLELSRFEKQNGKYAKVIMKLGEVLEGDFFNEYVKKGWS